MMNDQIDYAQFELASKKIAELEEKLSEKNDKLECVITKNQIDLECENESLRTQFIALGNKAKQAGK
jgi:hypothetical protein